MPRRLDLEMTWEQICNHYADSISEMLHDREDFVNWMMSKESIGKGRVLTDPKQYLYCYSVARRLEKREKDHFTVIVGAEGLSKSWQGATISSLISPTFGQRHILYEPGEVIDAFKTAKPGDTIHIDEGVLFLFSRTAMSGDNVATTTIFQLIRQSYLHIVICIPQFKDLDAYVRKHRTDTLILMKSRGSPRYYLKPGIDIINEVYPKSKNKISGVKVPSKYWFDGRTRKLFPVINDLSLEAYEHNKRQNLMETLDRLGDKLRKGRKNTYNAQVKDVEKNDTFKLP